MKIFNLIFIFIAILNSADALRIRIKKNGVLAPVFHFCSHNPLRKAPAFVGLINRKTNAESILSVKSNMFPSRINRRLEFCYKLNYSKGEMPTVGGVYNIDLRDAKGRSMPLKNTFSDNVVVIEEDKKVKDIPVEEKETAPLFDKDALIRTKSMFDEAMARDQAIIIDGRSYSSLEYLNQGVSSAHVYFAIDDDSKQAVVIKFLKTNMMRWQPYDREYMHEKKALARLGILIQGSDDKGILVQERLKGMTMTKAIQDSTNFNDGLKFRRIFQDAYDSARALGLEHEDLRTDNVIIDENGKGHLIDWGQSAFITPAPKGSRKVKMAGFVSQWWYKGPIKQPEGTPMVFGGKTFYSLGLDREYSWGSLEASVLVRDEMGRNVKLYAKLIDRRRGKETQTTVKYNDGSEQTIKYTDYLRLKEAVEAMGRLEAFDDDEQTLAILQVDGEDLHKFVERTGDMDAAKTFWIQAFEEAHQQGVLIDRYVTSDIYINSGGKARINNLEYAIKLENYLPSDAAIEMFEREMIVVKRLWQKCLKRRQNYNRFGIYEDGFISTLQKPIE